MLWLLKIVLLVYVGFGGLLYVAQRSMMYLPAAENAADDTPFEQIDVDGATLKVWVVGDREDDALIYFGGNAEDVYYNVVDFRRHLPETTVYLVNYRGYGGSSGSPSEQALFADALQLFDRLSPRHARLAAMGRSLGSGVAVYLAAERPVDRLLLVTPPDSALAVARRLYPIYPVGVMLKDRYESVAYAPHVTAPTRVLIAEHDRVIPRAHSERLVDAFVVEPEAIVIDGSGHNDLSLFDAYWHAVAGFMSPAGE